MSTRERPRPEAEGARSDGEEALKPRIARSADKYPVTGSILIDLRGVEEQQIRHVCDEMRQAPDGVLVVLVVGDRWVVDYHALPVIREQVGRLPIEVQGGSRAVARWLRAIRTGNVGDGIW